MIPGPSAVDLVTAAAWNQSLAWECPYAMGVAIKKKKEEVHHLDSGNDAGFSGSFYLALTLKVMDF